MNFCASFRRLPSIAFFMAVIACVPAYAAHLDNIAAPDATDEATRQLRVEERTAPRRMAEARQEMLNKIAESIFDTFISNAEMDRRYPNWEYTRQHLQGFALEPSQTLERMEFKLPSSNDGTGGEKFALSIHTDRAGYPYEILEMEHSGKWEIVTQSGSPGIIARKLHDAFGGGESDVGKILGMRLSQSPSSAQGETTAFAPSGIQHTSARCTLEETRGCEEICNKGVGFACSLLGASYEEGAAGVALDLKRAAYFYKKAIPLFQKECDDDGDKKCAYVAKMEENIHRLSAQ